MFHCPEYVRHRVMVGTLNNKATRQQYLALPRIFMLGIAHHKLRFNVYDEADLDYNRTSSRKFDHINRQNGKRIRVPFPSPIRDGNEPLRNLEETTVCDHATLHQFIHTSTKECLRMIMKPEEMTAYLSDKRYDGQKTTEHGSCGKSRMAIWC